MAVGDVGRTTRIVPFAKPVTGWDESKCLSESCPCRLQHTLDGSDAATSRQLLVRDQQMPGTAISTGEILAPGNGDGVHHHSWAEQTTALVLRRMPKTDP